MADSVGVKITQNQYDAISRDLVLDLEAVFKVIEGDMKDLIRKSVRENWTPERLIKEIENSI